MADEKISKFWNVATFFIHKLPFRSLLHVTVRKRPLIHDFPEYSYHILCFFSQILCNKERKYCKYDWYLLASCLNVFWIISIDKFSCLLFIRTKPSIYSILWYRTKQNVHICSWCKAMKEFSLDNFFKIRIVKLLSVSLLSYR